VILRTDSDPTWNDATFVGEREREQTFFASDEFSRITYREVRSSRLEDVLNDENWPQDIRDYRNSIRRSDGVPLWLIISNRAVVEHQFGTTAWHERILPRLRSYLR